MKAQRDVLGWAAMLACIAVTAHGEWSLAARCGYDVAVAAGLPVAIDAYALRAMQAGREIFPPVLLMVATNAAAHLVHGGMLEISPPLVVAVSAIAPVVLWRVHALRHQAAAELAEPGEETPVPAAVPVSVPAAPEASVPAAAAAPAVPVLGSFVSVDWPGRTPAGTTAGTGGDQGEPPRREALESGRGTAPGTTGTSRAEDGSGSGPEDDDAGRFARHVATARAWLEAQPDLTGTAIGKRLGASDSYGRRVRRAALSTV